jgi:hypothetical protein
MAVYHVTHMQAVWERACFVVEAESEAEAKEKVWAGEIEETLWQEITGSVEGMDSEIEDVRPAFRGR